MAPVEVVLVDTLVMVAGVMVLLLFLPQEAEAAVVGVAEIFGAAAVVVVE
jgi:hypothetical protein